jgi:hypothetical protein
MLSLLLIYSILILFGVNIPDPELERSNKTSDQIYLQNVPRHNVSTTKQPDTTYLEQKCPKYKMLQKQNILNTKRPEKRLKMSQIENFRAIKQCRLKNVPTTKHPQIQKGPMP